MVCFAYDEEDSISNHTGGKSNVGRGLLALSLMLTSVTLVCVLVCLCACAHGDSVMLRSSVTLASMAIALTQEAGCARRGHKQQACSTTFALTC